MQKCSLLLVPIHIFSPFPFVMLISITQSSHMANPTPFILPPAPLNSV